MDHPIVWFVAGGYIIPALIIGASAYFQHVRDGEDSVASFGVALVAGLGWFAFFLPHIFKAEKGRA